MKLTKFKLLISILLTIQLFEYASGKVFQKSKNQNFLRLFSLQKGQNVESNNGFNYVARSLTFTTNLNSITSEDDDKKKYTKQQGSNIQNGEHHDKPIKNMVMHDLETIVTSFESSDFEGDEILEQYIDPLNDFTTYKLPGGSVKKGRAIYQHNSNDKKRDVIILKVNQRIHNNSTRNNELYVGLRRKQKASFQYYVFYIYVRDAKPGQYDTNLKILNGQRKIVEFDSWDDREAALDRVIENKFEKYYGWSSCPSTILLPCKTTQFIMPTEATQIQTNYHFEKPKALSRNSATKKGRNENHEEQFKTIDGYNVDQYLEFLSDLDDEAKQQGRGVIGGDVNLLTQLGGTVSGLVGGLGATLAALVGGVGATIGGLLGSILGSAGPGNGINLQALASAGPAQILNLGVNLGGGLLGGAGGAAGGAGGQAAGGMGNLLNLGVGMAGSLGGAAGGQGQAQGQGQGQGGAGGGAAGGLGNLLNLGVGMAGNLGGAAGGQGQGQAQGGGAGGGYGGGAGGADGGAGGMGNLLNVGVNMAGSLGGAGAGGAGAGGNLVGGLLGGVGGLVGGLVGTVGQLVTTVGGGLGANLVGSIVSLGMGVVNSLGIFGGLGTPNAKPAEVGNSVGIKNVDEMEERLPEGDKEELDHEMQNGCSGGLGGLLEIDVDLALDESGEEEGEGTGGAADSEKQEEVGDTAGLEGGLEEEKPEGDEEATEGEGEATEGGEAAEERRRRKRRSLSFGSLKFKTLQEELLRLAIKSKLYQKPEYVYTQRGWKISSLKMKPMDSLAHESEPFIGFGICPYKKITQEDWNKIKDGRDIMELMTVVLRTYCIKDEVKFYNDLLSTGILLFDEKTKTLNIDANHQLLKHKKLGKKASIWVSRAFELSLLTKAYLTELLSETETTLPCGCPAYLSRRVHTLGQALLNGIDTLKFTMTHHRIQLLRSLGNTAKTAFLKLVHDQEKIDRCLYDVGQECQEDSEKNYHDQTYLMSIMQLIIHGLDPIYNGNQTAHVALGIFEYENAQLIEDKLNGYYD